MTLAVAIVSYSAAMYMRTGVLETTGVTAILVLVCENSSKWQWPTVNALIAAWYARLTRRSCALWLSKRSRP